MYRKYVFKPTGMVGVGALIEKPYLPSQFAEYRFESTVYTLNSKTMQGTSRKRYGYTNHNTSTGAPGNIGRFTVRKNTSATYPNTDFNFYLTTANFCQDWQSSEGGKTDDTFKYINPTYTTGTITDITGTTVTGSGTTWTTNVKAGDYFIMNNDHTADVEPDANWIEVASVTDDTHLELNSAYTINGTAYKIRQVFGGPPAGIDTWSWCVVNDKLIFCNGNDNVHVFDPGDTYASVLDSTNAKKWYHCIEYANRCVLANEKDVDAISVQWSKENDPTDWTDSTAGSASLQLVGSEITGLGKLGSYLVVFTPKSLVFGYRTGVSTSPIAFQDEKVGVGANAPRSIVHANGTIYFMGEDNFYVLEGTNAVPIGHALRDEIFDNESTDDLALYHGAHNARDNEIWWYKYHSQTAFVYDYIHGVWSVYLFTGDSMYIHSAGSGMKELNDKDPTFFLGLASSDSQTTTKVVEYAPAYTGDNSTAINYRYRTATTDFSDQDPEAEGRWKIVHRVRVIYRDLSTDTALTCYGAQDDSSAPNQFGTSSNTVGSGSGYVDTTDFDETMTGNWFSFIVTNNTANKKVQIVGIEVYYSLGGVFFDV
jgi:hypothetical protein